MDLNPEHGKFYAILVMSSLVIILIAGANLPAVANASSYSAYEGVSKTSTVRGVRGEITITSTPLLTTGTNNHRDFMVHINLRNSQAIGSGAQAYKIGSTVTVSSAEYVYDTGGVTHIINNIPIPTNTPFTASVQQTTQTSDCYQAVTYGSSSPVYTKCFASSTYPTNNVGMTAQTVPNFSGSSSETAPGKFDFLLAGGWNQQGQFSFGDYFSSTTTVNYKCANLNGYHLDLQASYTGNSSLWDKVVTGPPSTVDDCSSSNTGYAPFGE